MIPFGFAVVPLVYMRNSRSSLSIGSHGQAAGSSGWPSTTDAQVTSRPAVIVALWPVRSKTITVATFGARASASSALAFSGTVRPRRQPSSWVMRTSHSMSVSRPASASAENPPNTTVNGAPRRAQASMAIASSGTMPM